MAKHTQRDLELWKAWWAMEQSHPDRGDFYVMQLTAEVRRLFAKHPERIRLMDFKLMAREPKPANVALAKQSAVARMIGPVKHVIVDKTGKVLRTEVLQGGRSRA